MDIKTLEQALKLQVDLTNRITQSLVTQRTGKMPSIETLLKEKEQLLARAKAEVETTIKERDAVVSRWDERVAQRKASADKLKTEMSDLNKKLKELSKIKETGKMKEEVPGKKSR